MNCRLDKRFIDRQKWIVYSTFLICLKIFTLLKPLCISVWTFARNSLLSFKIRWCIWSKQFFNSSSIGVEAVAEAVFINFGPLAPEDFAFWIFIFNCFGPAAASSVSLASPSDSSCARFPSSMPVKEKEESVYQQITFVDSTNHFCRFDKLKTSIDRQITYIDGTLGVRQLPMSDHAESPATWRARLWATTWPDDDRWSSSGELRYGQYFRPEACNRGCELVQRLAKLRWLFVE